MASIIVNHRHHHLTVFFSLIFIIASAIAVLLPWLLLMIGNTGFKIFAAGRCDAAGRAMTCLWLSEVRDVLWAQLLHEHYHFHCFAAVIIAAAIRTVVIIITTNIRAPTTAP